MNWIKCTDKLPNNGTWVLIADDIGVSFAKFDDGVWTIHAGLCRKEPTHWMRGGDIPLPNQPHDLEFSVSVVSDGKGDIEVQESEIK